MNNAYAIAYTELLELLKYLPKDEFDKIPKEKIEFYENNKDTDYKFVYDPSKSLQEQNVSKKTNGIIVMLFRDYFATESQKEKLKNILKQNEAKRQEEAREKYNSDNLFKKRNEVKEYEMQEQSNIVSMVEYKESLIKRIINKIKNFFRK